MLNKKKRLGRLYKTGVLVRVFQFFMVAVLVSMTFYPAYSTQLILTEDFFYAVARGAGNSIKKVLPFLFLPTLRMINAKIYRLFKKINQHRILDELYNHRVFLHKLLGFSLVMLSGIHILAHVFAHTVSFFALESLTGMALMGVILIPLCSVAVVYSSRFFKNSIANKKSYYLQFLIPHQLGWWGLLLVFGFHTHDLRLLYCSLGVFFVFSIDRIWEWIKSKNVRVAHIEHVHEKMIIIEVEKPKNYTYQTGDKIYLSYPTRYAYLNQLHPFTAASSSNENILRFVISESGEWSKALIQNMKENHRVRVSPAFPSSLNTGELKKERLFITSGSGMAVTLAYLHDIDNQSPIHILHSSREYNEFILFQRYGKQKKYPIQSEMYFYTNKEKQNEKERKSIHWHNGRFIPSKSDFLKKFEGEVIFCGNEELGNELEKMLEESDNKVLFREKFT